MGGADYKARGIELSEEQGKTHALLHVLIHIGPVIYNTCVLRDKILLWYRL